MGGPAFDPYMMGGAAMAAGEFVTILLINVCKCVCCVCVVLQLTNWHTADVQLVRLLQHYMHVSCV
jgi:hypothetical protein